MTTVLHPPTLVLKCSHFIQFFKKINQTLDCYPLYPRIGVNLWNPESESISNQFNFNNEKVARMWK